VIRLRRQQWIAAAKEKPGTLTVGTSSAGTTNYLAALLFKSMQRRLRVMLSNQKLCPRS
jgi:hypothetical protein